ncbi:MAG: LPS export ABC transporter periplasmic protein LptC [Pseudomonadota bacterium]
MGTDPSEETQFVIMGPNVSAQARRVQRHSALVRQLRLAIPALAVGLAMTYAFSATPPRIDTAFAAQFQNIDESGEGLKLAQPRYSGEDLTGRPFEVVASTATRGEDDPDRIDLEAPRATRVTDSGAEIAIRADEGLYDQNAQVMNLTTNVEMQQQSGADRLTLLTDSATMDLEGQVVRSTSEVTGQGERGSLRADRGTLYQTEDKLVLEGQVRILLAPTPASEDSSEQKTTSRSDKDES